jgi:hypothetical protein
MLLGNPSNHAKQPVQHCMSNPEQLLPGNPAIATTPPATIDAMCLSELIILTNPIPIPGPIRSPHYIIQRRSDPNPGHYIQRHTLAGGVTLYI